MWAVAAALIDLRMGRTTLDTGLAVMMAGYLVCALIGWVCAYRSVFSPMPHMMKRWRAVSAVGLFIWAVVPVSCMVAFVLFT